MQVPLNLESKLDALMVGWPTLYLKFTEIWEITVREQPVCAAEFTSTSCGPYGFALCDPNPALYTF